MPKKIKQLSRKEKQNLIKSTIRSNQGLSNKKIARLLGVSPTSVAKYRLELFGASNLDSMPEDANADDWTQHIWVKQHPEIFNKKLSARTLKCLRTPGVLDKLVELEGKTVSPRLALTLLRKEQREQNKNPIITITEDDVLLFVADLKKIDNYAHIKPASVSLVLVDMPYPAKYLDLYLHLAHLCSIILKPSGSLICLCGQSYLPNIMSALESSLNYNWLLSYRTPSNGTNLIHTRRVIPKWKAILWYTKGKPDKNLAYVPDEIIPPPLSKDDVGLHHWQQSLPAFIELVKHFSSEGDTIMDCCMGSGTTVIAALIAGGRKVIGSDNDLQAVTTAKRRVKEFWIADK